MTIASNTARFGGGATAIARPIALPYAAESKLALWYFVVAIVAFAVGGLFGTFQSLNYSGFDRAIGFDAYSDVPFIASYYQGLTFHGVLLVLVWTTFFISGFLTYVTVNALQRPLVTMT
ncbi:MAG: cbb3-type cytochrome c oxidase subunit I, partial [Dehalococcoidia bacterium]|nr:cbb3-type cytochrome c oxidase subunit I [Dehalococcoidia bacterium]